MKLQTPVQVGAGVAPATARAASPWRGGLTAAYASEVGEAHAQNEDCCSHVPSGEAPVFCGVADGVGGGAHGEIASSALLAHCAQAPREVYRDAGKLLDWLIKADAEVREAIARRSAKPGAATLAAAWFASPGSALVANVGDCRAYRLRPTRLACRIEQLTVDQTYARLAQQPPPNGSINDPARMVGAGALGSPPVVKVRLRAGELLLLCSDGVHKFVGNTQIAGIVGQGLHEGRSLKRICAALVAAARDNGSQDDASALLVLRRAWFGASWLLPCVLAALAALWLTLGQGMSVDDIAANLEPQSLWQRMQDLWQQWSVLWSGSGK
jgi:serine/threonine protein phosphatase PrpC